MLNVSDLRRYGTTNLLQLLFRRGMTTITYHIQLWIHLSTSNVRIPIWTKSTLLAKSNEKAINECTASFWEIVYLSTDRIFLEHRRIKTIEEFRKTEKNCSDQVLRDLNYQIEIVRVHETDWPQEIATVISGRMSSVITISCNSTRCYTSHTV